MALPVPIAVAAELSAAVAALAVAVLAWRSGDRPGGRALAALSTSASAWSVASAANTVVRDPAGTRWLVMGADVASTAVVASWFVLAVRYTGADRLDRPGVYAALGSYAAVELLLVVTDPLYDLYLGGATVESGVLVGPTGPGWIAHRVVAVAVALTGVGVFLAFLRGRRGPYRRQKLALLAAGVAGLAGVGVELLAPAATPRFDVSTVGIAVTSGILLWALYSASLLEVLPVARATIVREMDDAVVAVDADGRVVDCNAEARRLLGVDDAIGRRAGAAFADHPELLAQIRRETDVDHDGAGGDDGPDASPDPAATTAASGDATEADGGPRAEPSGDASSASTTPGSDDELTITRDGETRYYDLRVSAVYEGGPGVDPDDGGRAVGAVVVVRDVTERRRRERELELLKTVLTRVLRHNVRNDLGVVQGTAELLEERVDDAERPLVEQIHDTTGDVVELSEKARDVVRLVESPRGRERLSLARNVETALDRVRRDHPDADLRVDVPDLQVRAHRSLPLAVENLVENAVEHAGEDPTVEVTARRTNGRVDLVVGDDGPGIPETELAVLASGTETSLEHGSGIGLWLVSWVADRSEADLSFESDDGCRVRLGLEAAPGADSGPGPDDGPGAGRRTSVDDRPPA